jgi:hypothetical protein
MITGISMLTLSTEEHNELIHILRVLKKQVEEMLKFSSDILLIWQKNEITDWLNFIVEHADIEELKSLEKEVNKMFFEKFNVRIESSNLDNVRLETFEQFICRLHEILH